jgi:hypothetical protein
MSLIIEKYKSDLDNQTILIDEQSHCVFSVSLNKKEGVFIDFRTDWGVKSSVELHERMYIPLDKLKELINEL